MTQTMRARVTGASDAELAALARDCLRWMDTGLLAQDGVFARLRDDLEACGEWLDERSLEQAILREAAERLIRRHGGPLS